MTGSAFTPEPYTNKLEGSGIIGYQSLVAGSGPEVLAGIDVWQKSFATSSSSRCRPARSAPDDCTIEIRCYGGTRCSAISTDRPRHREVAMLLVTANDQATATRVVKVANPYLLHMPLPDMEHLPSFAFMASPAEIERGPLYEFFLNHVVRVSSPGELSRTVITDIGAS